MLTAIDRHFLAVNKVLLIALMATMTALVFTNVVGRYVFGVSFGWADELSRFAMIWTAFLGMGIALRHGQLVAVDALQTVFPPRVEKAIRMATALIVAAFLVALLILGIQFVEFSWSNRTPVLRIPRGIPYLAIPLGAAFALAHLAIGAAAYLRRDWQPMAELDRDVATDIAGVGALPTDRPGEGRP